MSYSLEDKRYIKFLELLPKHNGNITRAGIEAGYTEEYASSRGQILVDIARKRLLKQIEKNKKLKQIKPPKKDHNPLLREEERDIETIMKDNNTGIINKQNNEVIAEDQLNKLIGLSRQDFSKEVRKIATQDKDLSTKFKVLQSLSKYTDIDLSTESAQKQTIPTLNILIRKQDTKEIKQAEIVSIQAQQTEQTEETEQTVKVEQVTQEDQKTQLTPYEESERENELSDLLGVDE